ncbi:MAG: hypothetical protein RSC93_05670 [Erysipelotrichaceae bacterium]
MSCNLLAYLSVCLKDKTSEFSECYCFMNPTILYLPNGFVMNIEKIKKCEIELCISNVNDLEIKEMVKLNLCDKNEVAISVNLSTGLVNLNICLNGISTFKKRCN